MENLNDSTKICFRMKVLSCRCLFYLLEQSEIAARKKKHFSELRSTKTLICKNCFFIIILLAQHGSPL